MTFDEPPNEKPHANQCDTVQATSRVAWDRADPACQSRDERSPTPDVALDGDGPSTVTAVAEGAEDGNDPTDRDAVVAHLEHRPGLDPGRLGGRS